MEKLCPLVFDSPPSPNVDTFDLISFIVFDDGASLLISWESRECSFSPIQVVYVNSFRIIIYIIPSNGVDNRWSLTKLY